jgi:hypothetical protein
MLKIQGERLGEWWEGIVGFGALVAVTSKPTHRKTTKLPSNSPTKINDSFKTKIAFLFQQHPKPTHSQINREPKQNTPYNDDVLMKVMIRDDITRDSHMPV